MTHPEPTEIIHCILILLFTAENLGIVLFNFNFPLLQVYGISFAIFIILLCLTIWTKFGYDSIYDKLKRWYANDTTPKNSLIL